MRIKRNLKGVALYRTVWITRFEQSMDLWQDRLRKEWYEGSQLQSGKEVKGRDPGLMCSVTYPAFIRRNSGKVCKSQ